MITYKVSSDKSIIEEMCKEAVSNRLYVNGWRLRSVMNFPMHIEKMAIAYDKKPIGCSTFKNNHIMVFVRKSYRRCGIGSELCRVLEVENPECFIGHMKHDEYREAFFSKIYNKFIRI